MRNIDGKFSTDGTKIFYTVSGEEIPEDEPLFLLRARDLAAIVAIERYYEECSCVTNELHLRGILQVWNEFRDFKERHPERMKEPGKTRHLKLKESI